MFDNSLLKAVSHKIIRARNMTQTRSAVVQFVHQRRNVPFDREQVSNFQTSLYPIIYLLLKKGATLHDKNFVSNDYTMIGSLYPFDQPLSLFSFL